MIQNEWIDPQGRELDFTPELLLKRRSQLRIISERFLRNKVAVFGFAFLILMALAAIFAPILTHQTATVDPANDTHIEIALQDPSSAHLLGTDEVGRDEFARLLFGARVSLLVGVASMLISLLVGLTIGSIAGYYGGWVDNTMMRVTDALLALPLILLLFVLSASFSSGSIQSVILLIGTLSWANTARIVRGEFLTFKESEFVLAARTLGASDLRLMLRHILPSALGAIIVNATLLVGSNIITESTLSFFNFGIQPPQASWGSMLGAGQDYVASDQLLVLVPGLAIFVTVLCINLMGDGLRDAFDPYMIER